MGLEQCSSRAAKAMLLRTQAHAKEAMSARKARHLESTVTLGEMLASSQCSHYAGATHHWRDPVRDPFGGLRKKDGLNL